MQPVFAQSHHGGQHDDQNCERRCHRDMAGIGEAEGDQAEHIAHQNEEEKREDEREEASSLRPDLFDAHVVDELVGELRRRLQPAGHHRARPHAVIQQSERQQAADHHQQVGLGEVHRGANRAERGSQLELAQRVDRRFA